MTRTSLLKILTIAALTLAIGTLATPASAQLTAVLKGKVVDEAGKPVEGAEVKGEFLGDVNREFAMKSDMKGEFLRAGLAPGAWKITATKDGLVGTAPRIQLSLGDPNIVPPIALGQPKPAAAAHMSAKDVEAGKYGRRLHFWDWQKRERIKSVDLKESGLIPLEVRFHHNPAITHGLIGAALSSTMWHWHHEGCDRSG